MRKFKMVSGAETVKCLCKNFNGTIIHQKGSHIKIKFLNGKLTIVPNHKELDRFTLKNILELAGISIENFYRKL